MTEGIKEKEIKLAWDLPKFWVDIEQYEEELKNLKNIYSDYKRFLVLLYRGLNYQNHAIWSQEPKISDTNKHINSLKKILKNYGLFYPFTRVNKEAYRDIELILIHVFIPKPYAENYLNVVYKLYKELNGNLEDIETFNKETLQNYFNFETLGTHVIDYVLYQKALIPKFKDTIKEIFEIWNEELDVYSFPDWFGKIVVNFKRKKEELKGQKRKYLSIENSKITICDSLKRSGKEMAFFDAEGKRIKPLFDQEKKEIVLTKQPYYIVVKNNVRTSLDDNYNFIRYEDPPYLIYEIFNYPLNNEEIENYRLYVYKENISKYVNIQGEKIPYLKPLYKEGIVSYDKIKIDFQRQEFLTLTLITPSEEVYDTNDLMKKNEFSEEGKYILKYTVNRSKESLSEFEKFQVYSEEKIIYVFKEKPRLLGNFHIKYKNRIYKMGEIIEEPFGRFKVEIVYIDKEKTKIEENILKVNIKNSEIVDKTYVKLFNNCGFFIVTFEVRKNGQINIDLSPYLKYLVFPIKVCLQLPRERIFTDCIFLEGKGKNICPFKKFREVAMHYCMGVVYKYNLPRFKLKQNLPINIRIERTLFFFLKKILNIKEHVEPDKLLKELEEFLNKGEYCRNEIARKLFNSREFGELLNRYFYLEDKT